jgi:hypothetical protein
MRSVTGTVRRVHGEHRDPGTEDRLR